MNNIEEIKEQSRFDCFTKLYGCLARAMIRAGGMKGERAVREAAARYGEMRGERLRKRHRAEGRLLNLRTLLTEGCCCGEDPRFVTERVRDNPQAQLLEVYSCPMEQVWRKMGAEQEGQMYCEEYIRGLIKAYTKGKGQANLSDLLTCGRDNFCRFSLYLRPANLDKGQREECFGTGQQGELQLPREKVGCLLEEAESRYDTEEEFLSLYFCLAASAEEILGQDGIKALSDGLSELSENVEQSLLLQADRTGEDVGEEFLRQYFPLCLRESPDLGELEGTFGAGALLCTRLLGRLRARLGQKPEV